jgi:hypothetical protein
MLRVQNGGGWRIDKKRQAYVIQRILNQMPPIGPCIQSRTVLYGIGSGRLLTARNDIVAGA